MLANLPDHVKGLLLALIGGLVLTIDIPLLRLASGDPWSVMLMRSGMVLAVCAAVLLSTRLASGKAVKLVPGKTGLWVTLLYGASAIFFLVAVFHTSTANLVFILAFNPMFAALLAWIFLGERPKAITLVAMVLMALGVLIIVHDGLAAGSFFGDVLALLAGLSIAAAITITRTSNEDMGFTPLVGAIAPFAAALVMTGQTGFRIDHPWWLILNGGLVIPISFFCLARAPRYISGAEVAMFYLLETVLTPVWVWVVFSEVPTNQAMIGGMILIVTLIAHSVWQLVAGRRRKAAKAVRHPV